MEGVSLPSSLEDARIAKLPPSAYYIANFISEEEEYSILEKVKKSLEGRLLGVGTDFLLLFRSPRRRNPDGSS